MAHLGKAHATFIAVLGVCASAPAARAANCEVTSSWLPASTFSTSGALIVVTDCHGDSPGCTGDLPALLVTRGDVDVPGDIEALYAGANRRYVVFRPQRPWLVGTYHLRGIPASFQPQEADFEVTSAPSSFQFDETAVSVTVDAVVAPTGERVCCPSSGEGDCRPSCGGLDGEQRVAEVRAHFPVEPISVIWRVADTDAHDAQLAIENRLQIDDPRERYCLRIEAWDAVDGTRHEVVRCRDFDGKAERIGEASVSWSGLNWDRCSAPPVVGGYGYDIRGDRVPDPAPPVDEQLRAAFCDARRDACAGPIRSCLETEWCPCRYYADYCADAEDAAGGTHEADAGNPADAPDVTGDAITPSTTPTRDDSGCSLHAGEGPRGGLAWLAAGLLALVRRRRTVTASRDA